MGGAFPGGREQRRPPGQLAASGGDQRRDPPRICISDGAPGLAPAAIGDEGALTGHAQRPLLGSLAVEVEPEYDEIAIGRVGGDLLKDRGLRAAHRAPGRSDVDQDRAAGTLCGLKGFGRKGPKLGRMGGLNQHRGGGGDCEGGGAAGE